MKLLLENIDKPDLKSIDVYLKYGGYNTLENILGKKSPDEVTEEVKT